ncbi:MAG: cytochrome c oxidase subunit II, partial [Chloroflexota bacterium]|nr:cytochrome c oxidase subunit II [Chloroflexota bacterium]
RERPRTLPRAMRLSLLVAGAAPVGCSGALSTLDPAGPQARQIADLGWLMFALASAVFALVVALIGWGVWRACRRDDDARPRVGSLALVIGGGVVLPIAVIALLWVVSLQVMATLAVPPRPPAVEIEVTGRQFQYEVVYPERAITLRNEMRIPVGQPVLVRLHSIDVIHSFWVPRLGGKIDLIPGSVNEMWLEAAEPGTYEGRCAEFCGIGHTEMRLVVVALPGAEFDAWLAQAAP